MDNADTVRRLSLDNISDLSKFNLSQVSHASKRSRSQASSISSHSISSAELNMHPCPACDASFPTLQSLRQHGQRGSAQSNEACCIAVEYAFEQ